MFEVLSYTRSENLGDAVQTIALSRLLPGNLMGIDREYASCIEGMVINGWLGSNAVTNEPSPSFFVGIHVAQPHNIPWVQKSPKPVGARDPYTAGLLSEHGIQNEMIGCATLTFPRYDGPRSGIVTVDAEPDFRPDGALHLSHGIAIDLSWERQFERAIVHLDIYRKSSVVFTNRLHVALPCLAFGTPVVFSHGNRGDNRFSLLTHLGVKWGEPVTMDVSEIAGKYRSFLEKTIDIKIEEHEPVFPSDSSYHEI